MMREPQATPLSLRWMFLSLSFLFVLFCQAPEDAVSLSSELHQRKSTINDVTNSTTTTRTASGPAMTTSNGISNLRLVMMGDSLTRYQYLSLINYLHTNQWNTTYQQGPDTRDITTEHSFENWTNFFYFTNSIFDGQELCDCYRYHVRPRLTHLYLPTIRENRYFQQPEKGNYITYLLRYGVTETRGTVAPDMVYNHPRNDFFNVHTEDPLWEYDNWANVIRNILPQLDPKPTFFVFNAGAWQPHDLNETSLLEIRDALEEVQIRGIYKTTTKQHPQNVPREARTDQALKPYEKLACQLFPCLDMTWTIDLAPSDYVDRLHFGQHIYHDMNRRMLRFLDELDSKTE